jgi:Tfp pilus assembly protein PilX
MRALRARRARLTGEGGFAIVYVLALMVVVLAIGTAGLTESLSSRSLTFRDSRVRRAQQASDAGINRILYEEAETNISNWNMNGGPLGLSAAVDCIPVTLSASAQITGLVSTAVNSAGVCPQNSGSSSAYQEPLGNGAFEESEFIPAATNRMGGSENDFNPKIVALGFDTTGGNTVYARQLVRLAPIAALQAVEGMNNVTLNGLSALGLGSIAIAVNGDVDARGTLTLPTVYAGVNLTNGLKATIAAPTINGGVVSTVNGGTVSQSQIVQRPAITIDASKADCSVSCPSVSGGSGSDGYDSSTDTLTMTHAGASITLSSGDYVFCNFNVTAGTVNVSPTASAPVRIFVDSPNSARCKNDGLGSNQGNFIASTGINNLLSGAVAPSVFQVYVEGDGGGYDNATTVNIGDSATCTAHAPITGTCIAMSTPVTQEMVVYAPTSAVTINTGVCLLTLGANCTLGNAGVFDGAIVGDNVTVTASVITQDLDLGNYPLYDGVNVFRPIQYIQCDASVTSLTGNASTDTAGC